MSKRRWRVAQTLAEVGFHELRPREDHGLTEAPCDFSGAAECLGGLAEAPRLGQDPGSDAVAGPRHSEAQEPFRKRQIRSGELDRSRVEFESFRYTAEEKVVLVEGETGRDAKAEITSSIGKRHGLLERTKRFERPARGDVARRSVREEQFGEGGLV